MVWKVFSANVDVCDSLTYYYYQWTNLDQPCICMPVECPQLLLIVVLFSHSWLRVEWVIELWVKHQRDLTPSCRRGDWEVGLFPSRSRSRGAASWWYKTLISIDFVCLQVHRPLCLSSLASFPPFRLSYETMFTPRFLSGRHFVWTEDGGKIYTIDK